MVGKPAFSSFSVPLLAVTNFNLFQNAMLRNFHWFATAKFSPPGAAA
jgi:hypothetical protein